MMYVNLSPSFNFPFVTVYVRYRLRSKSLSASNYIQKMITFIPLGKIAFSCLENGYTSSYQVIRTAVFN